jgi:hypothetical protein
MRSFPILFAEIISSIGFLLNIGMVYLVLSRGRKVYHYLFSVILGICALWDFGVLLIMLRNSHESELIIYGYIIVIPCTFLQALIFQFTTVYLGQPKKKMAIFFWVISILGFLMIATGLGGKIDDIYQYSWGNVYRPDQTIQTLFLFWFPISLFAMLYSSWMHYQASKRESSDVRRRHLVYIAISFIALTLANVKLLVLYGVDNAFVLPFGMLVNDLFSALIAIAIVKHQLFDITVVIKKGTIYSVLAGIVIFAFSFSEHILINYVGKLMGEHSELIHFISIGVGIIVLMPVKHRVEALVEKLFAGTKVEI